MAYHWETVQVEYKSKDGAQAKVFDALEWLAAMCSCVPMFTRLRRAPPIDICPIYDEPPVPSVDDYMKDPEYPVESYF